MSPSPRKPRVPRIPSASSSIGDELIEARGQLGGRDAKAAGRDSLGHSAKVTLLRPVKDPDLPGDEPAEQGEGETPRIPGPPAKSSTKRRWASRGGKGAKPLRQPVSGPNGDVVAFPVPRSKRVRRRAVLVAASVVALVAGLMAVLMFTPVLAVRTITVEGTKMLSPAQVQSALAPLVGRPLPQVGPDEVNRLVLPIVQVKSVRTRAVPPNTLLVTVNERVPVALVKQQDGFSVVDGDGVEIAKAKDGSEFPVPVIDPQGAHMSHETFLAVTGVLSALPADVLGQMATASADSVDSVQLKLSNGKTVVWGNSQDRDLKAKVLQALMKNAENPPKGQAPVNVFDVSVPRHPVTR
jgi:cell division protein FtsQ